MTPAEAIAGLDRANAVAGQNIILRRYLGPGLTNPVNVTCRATVTGFRANELVNGVTQGDRKVIMSPTEATAAGWPLPVKVNDRVVIGGKETNVEDPENREIGGMLVRIKLRVRG